MHYLFWLFVIFCSNSLLAMIDLDQMAQDYVLEEKEIQIPGYAGAFNPSIIRWQNKLLLSFRVRDPLTKLKNQFGLIWLDEEFNPLGKPYLLKMRNKSPSLPNSEQDPRLIALNEDLYITYNNIIGPVALEMRRMFIGKVQYEDGEFFVENPEILLDFQGESSKKMEKNWPPFVWNNNFLLAYSIVPHRIFSPVFGENKCEFVAETSADAVWNWGELRGGTPALIHDDEFLAFFHTYKDISTVQSSGKKISHYFMGAYTFSKNPPFALTRISQEPIIGKRFYKEPFYDDDNWKPLRVVFPGGFIFDQQYIWIAYGRQDHELWIVKLDKKKLYESLTLL